MTPPAGPSSADSPEPPASAPPPVSATPPAAPVDGRNRLGDETSPYLLQHQHNPVHWWPWGEEAFAEARRRNVPIFLSVGYSTCYWCHVMERESFENETIARQMNANFVCIKVDREERPDVDEIYMSAVQIFTQLTTGRAGGGWPMSVFMEPEGLKPFFGGTYYPGESAPEYGRPSFPELMEFIATAWRDKHAGVLDQANQLARFVADSLSVARQPVPVGAADVENAVAVIMTSYDQADGGFGGGTNKFPTPVNIDLLMAAGWDQPPVRAAVLHTLDRMAIGGMYDQIGGGFHRYSTDRQWLVPHFEKMLYDNGQLATTYADAYERTGDVYYAEIVRETLDYVRREMTAPTGAFLSAQDAEVNHREGGNYIWLEDEVRTALTDAGLGDDADFAVAVYGLDKGPNFTDRHHPQDPRNVVRMANRPDAVAGDTGMSLGDFETRISRVNAALLAVRDARDQPITDDKILAGWNGLMIAGMADGGRALERSDYVDAARRAADFVLKEMRAPDGALDPPGGIALHRTFREGKARIDAFLEDYAFMIRGLVALYRATGDESVREAAVGLAGTARARFWDESVGSYFDTLADQSDLFVRVKTTYDGATPSGNGTMLVNLLDLHEITGDEKYLDDAVACARALSPDLKERPTACVVSMRGLHRLAQNHADRLDRDPALAAAGVGGAAAGADAVITIATSVDEIRLAPGATETFDIVLKLAGGFHVNAHEPGIDYLIPLGIGLSSGDGLEIEVAYPDGERFDGPEGAMLVHRGTVRIPVTIKRTGAITGKPRVMLTYQICNDRECLAPKTEPLAVTVVGE